MGLAVGDIVGILVLAPIVGAFLLFAASRVETWMQGPAVPAAEPAPAAPTSGGAAVP